VLGINQGWRFTAWSRSSFLMLSVGLHWSVLTIDLFPEDDSELIALWSVGNKFYGRTGGFLPFEIPRLDPSDAHGLL